MYYIICIERASKCGRFSEAVDLTHEFYMYDLGDVCLYRGVEAFLYKKRNRVQYSRSPIVACQPTIKTHDIAKNEIFSNVLSLSLVLMGLPCVESEYHIPLPLMSLPYKYIRHHKNIRCLLHIIPNPVLL